MSWVLALLTLVSFGDASLPDWSILNGRSTQPTCVDIPKNLSLCHGIGYSKMRLPNLLNHDSMAEVSQQAGSWIPLWNVRCHPDTQLFLCSLFSPVCLDRLIFPCRSLCEQVKSGCEARMRAYGFPWPDMLRCDKFPIDNDMCILPMSGKQASRGKTESCETCSPVETYENILDNYCRAKFVIKTRIRRQKKNQLFIRKPKVYKNQQNKDGLLMAGKLILREADQCCHELLRKKKDKTVIMGFEENGELIPTFVMPWTRKSKALRQAVRMFDNVDCSDPTVVSQGSILETPEPRKGRSNARKKDKNPRRKRKRKRVKAKQATKDQ